MGFHIKKNKYASRVILMLVCLLGTGHSLANNGILTSSLNSVEQEENCKIEVGLQKACWIGWKKERRGVLTDVAFSPTLEEGGEIKLGLVRYGIELFEDKQTPFFILVSDVTSQTSDAEANNIKLIDPDQGLNLGFEGALDYRLGSFCSQKKNNARCTFGVKGGARYLSIETVDSSNTNTLGAFLSLSNRWSFDILKWNNDESKAEDEGLLSFDAQVNYYHHESASPDDFFAGISDASGNLTEFDNSFGSYSFGVDLRIDKQFSISLSRTRPFGDSNLDNQNTFSINFSVDTE